LKADGWWENLPVAHLLGFCFSLSLFLSLLYGMVEVLVFRQDYEWVLQSTVLAVGMPQTTVGMELPLPAFRCGVEDTRCLHLAGE